MSQEPRPPEGGAPAPPVRRRLAAEVARWRHAERGSPDPTEAEHQRLAEIEHELEGPPWWPPRRARPLGPAARRRLAIGAVVLVAILALLVAAVFLVREADRRPRRPIIPPRLTLAPG